MAAFQLHHHGTSSSPSMEDDVSASKTKLCIKLKIPDSINTRVPAQSHDGDEDGEGEGHIICEYCGKRFSSGKAWGGHKRHHLQMKKKQKLQQAPKIELFKKKAKQCRTLYSGDFTIKDDGRPICCLCYKVFPSLNSLFGHMRFHPDRDWRGIQPPQIVEIEKGNISDERIDLLSDLVGWLKKDKRGRVCIPDLIPQAAYNLITLSRWSGTKSEKTKTTDSVTNWEYGNVIESEEIDGMEAQFNCEICKKNFATGQALGGHKRCHWKPSANPQFYASTGESNVNGKPTLDLNKPYVIQDGDEGETTNNLFTFKAD